MGDKPSLQPCPSRPQSQQPIPSRFDSTSEMRLCPGLALTYLVYTVLGEELSVC